MAPPPRQLSPAQWDEAVAKYADKLMGSEKVRQLSNLFDAPQYAQQFIDLARKQSECRDMRIRARCTLTDAKGSPILNPKTKTPRIGWAEYQFEISKAAKSACSHTDALFSEQSNQADRVA